MTKKTYDRLFQLLKWIIIICLFIISLLFVKAVWFNFQEKLTSFATFQEPRFISPTTVLCFDPYVKSTIKKEHDIKKQLSISVMPGTWSEYQNEAFFHMNSTNYSKNYVTYFCSPIFLLVEILKILFSCWWKF